MNKRPVQKHLVHVLLLSLIVLLVGGGVALLNQWQQGPVRGHASDDTVVGSPSLPASYVDAILRRVGSPMMGTGQAVEQAARAQNIDDAFALAVWWTETNDGAAGVGRADRNPGSVRGSVGYPSAYDGYTIYPSYTAAVTYWFGMMKRVYISRGLTTVTSIAHPYVGTSTSNLWAGKVINLMNRYRAEAPPPPAATPTSTPTTASNTANIARHAKWLLQQDQGAASPPNTSQDQDANTQPDAASGLSNSTKLFLVLFDLLLALGLGLLARNMLKRYRSSVPIPGLAGGALQEKLRAGFPSFAGNASGRTTESLTWSAPSTGTLSAAYSPNSLFSQGAFMATQAQGAGYPQHTPYTDQLSFDTPVQGYPRTAHLPGLGLPSHSMQQPGTSALNSLHRTRLLPSRPVANQFSSLVEDAITEKLPQLVGAGQSSSFATTRQQEPQLVGAGAGGGRSNGLLSRYREMQTSGVEQRNF